MFKNDTKKEKKYYCTLLQAFNIVLKECNKIIIIDLLCPGF